MEIIEIFEALEATNSVKEKEKILSTNKANKELKDLIEANLNPYRLFQFTKMPSYTMARPVFKETTHNEFMTLLSDLERRVITGNRAKEAVIGAFSKLHRGQAQLYEKVLLKAAIGVGASTVNKVWKGLIPEFKLMLAPNKIPNLTQVKYPAFIQPKLDGYRCIYWEGKLWSRAGKPFGNKKLNEYFSSLDNVDNFVFDGELYIHGIKFQNLTSVLNTEDAPLPKGLKFVVYDGMSEKDWYAQSTKVAYEDRLKNIRELLNDRVADYKKIIDISSDLVNNAAEVLPIYKKYLKDGYEGAMIKAASGLYQWKRTSISSGEMLKLKPFKTVDLKIKEIYEGEGNFTGMAGGVVVDYNGVSVSVGSGLDLDLRKEMANKPDNYIGKTIEIQYFEETSDGSLRFPTLKRFRPEKD